MWESPFVIGPETPGGFKRSPSWGTAVQLGAGEKYRFLPHGITLTREDQPDDSMGQSYPKRSDKGSATVSGPLPGYMYWDWIDRLIACVMGGSTNPTFLGTPETGTATGGSATTLVDSGAAWTPDALIGKRIQITDVSPTPDLVKTVEITDNDATSVTFANIGFTVANLDTYAIDDGAASHLYTMRTHSTGIFGTLAFDNGRRYIEEFPSAKLIGFKIHCEKQKPLQITLDVEANAKVLNSVVNTLATMLALAEPSAVDDRMLHRFSRLRINEQSGGALGTGDIMTKWKSWDLVYKRGTDRSYGVGSDNDQIAEPGEIKVPERTLTIVRERHEDATHLINWEAGTKMKGDFLVTGPEIITGVNRQFLVEFPALSYTQANAPQKAEAFEETLAFDLHEAVAAPTGMTGVLPFQITLDNAYCGDPLQE
jgi:hypothetical protein